MGWRRLVQSGGTEMEMEMEGSFVSYHYVRNAGGAEVERQMTSSRDHELPLPQIKLQQNTASTCLASYLWIIECSFHLINKNDTIATRIPTKCRLSQ